MLVEEIYPWSNEHPYETHFGSIGVQPMIANIQFSFNFVGGQGLKESVDKLQNALSFNYYANTEIYDDSSSSSRLRDDCAS